MLFWQETEPGEWSDRGSLDLSAEAKMTSWAVELWWPVHFLPEMSSNKVGVLHCRTNVLLQKYASLFFTFCIYVRAYFQWGEYFRIQF